MWTLIQTAINATLMCLSIGTLKPINFPFFPNGKLTISGVGTLLTMKDIINCSGAITSPMTTNMHVNKLYDFKIRNNNNE